MKKKIKLRDFNVVDFLKDPQDAALYLNEALEYNGPNKEKYFLKSLRQVVEAHGMTEIARRSSVSRRTLYKALSGIGNPTWNTIVSIMAAINYHFRVV